MRRELNELLLPQQLGLNLFLSLGFIGVATHWNASLWTVLLILVAFVCARNAGHAFNQIADRDYDARNPRTKDRPIVTHRLSLRAAWVVVLANVALVLVATALLNHLVLLLAPVALALVMGYSYTKRYTAWTTVLLGLVEGMIPIGIYLAVEQAVPVVGLVGGFGVLCFGTGFETVHSLRDIATDRAQGLHSIPARLGWNGGVAVASLSFALAMVLFGLFGTLAGLGVPYLIALVGMGVALAGEIGGLSRGQLPVGKVFWANFAFGALFLAGVFSAHFL